MTRQWGRLTECRATVTVPGPGARPARTPQKAALPRLVVAVEARFAERRVVETAAPVIRPGSHRQALSRVSEDSTTPATGETVDRRECPMGSRATAPDSGRTLVTLRRTGGFSIFSVK